MGDAAGSWAEDLDLIRAAASAAGEVAMGFFGKSPEVWYKNENRSPVSAADFAANEKLAQMLRAARPNYGWLSEETEDDAARLGCETLFVVDPIDGTRAFIAGLDTWCVSVAVVHRAVPVAGAPPGAAAGPAGAPPAERGPRAARRAGAGHRPARQGPGGVPFRTRFPRRGRAYPPCALACLPARHDRRRTHRRYAGQEELP